MLVNSSRCVVSGGASRRAHVPGTSVGKRSLRVHSPIGTCERGSVIVHAEDYGNPSNSPIAGVISGFVSTMCKGSVIVYAEDYGNPSNSPIAGVISGFVSTIYKGSVIAHAEDYGNPSNSPIAGVISGFVSTIYKVSAGLTPTEAGLSPLWTAILRVDFDGVSGAEAVLPPLWTAILLAISSNADLNEVNANGDTPLTYIAKEGHYKYPPSEIPEALVKAGANIEATDRNRNTPLEISLLSGWQNVAELMLRYNAKTDGVAAIKTRVTCPVCKRMIAVYNMA
eukprot:gene3570-13647_t